MIYITGDTHGQYGRFRTPTAARLRGKTHRRTEDTLIICGDFGFLWDGSAKEQKLLQKIGKRRHNTLFVDGVHENFTMLSEYPTESWNGGDTRHICGNLRYLCRGQVFDIEGFSIFTMGGGVREDLGFSKTDSQDELDGLDGFDKTAGFAKSGTNDAPETPTADDIAKGLAALQKTGGKVDYVISYEPPGSVGDFRTITNRSGVKMPGFTGKRGRAGALETVRTAGEKLGFMDEIEKNITYGRWFFGKHHVNRIVTDKVFAVFDGIIRADHDVMNKKSGKRSHRNGGF
ncbi:hypothetical protein FACS1894120_1950 [Clostridia bacterium]|nr:hypothetical protein FACS1894120_1950 [Clostridia bacterium]